MNAESKMNASDIPDECLQDPQFVKVLTASLCSQIAESKKVLAGKLDYHFFFFYIVIYCCE